MVSVENYGSYLQAHASHSIPVSNIPSSEQTSISVSTGPAILTMLRQIDSCNKDLSECMDQLKCNDSMSSTPLTLPTLHHRRYSMTAPQPVSPRSLTQSQEIMSVTKGNILHQGWPPNL